MIKIVVSCFCQTPGLAYGLRNYLGDKAKIYANLIFDEKLINQEFIDKNFKEISFFVHSFSKNIEKLNFKNTILVRCPMIQYPEFHPDLSSISIKTSQKYHSGIVAAGYKLGITKKEIVKFFNKKIYDKLNFKNLFKKSKKILFKEFDNSDFKNEKENFFNDISKTRIFMHTPSHTTGYGFGCISKYVSKYIDNSLKIDKIIPTEDFLSYLQWSIYPNLLNYNDIKGNYFWKINFTGAKKKVTISSLEDFCNYFYSEYDQDPLMVKREYSISNLLKSKFEEIF